MSAILNSLLAVGSNSYLLLINYTFQYLLTTFKFIVLICFYIPPYIGCNFSLSIVLALHRKKFLILICKNVIIITSVNSKFILLLIFTLRVFILLLTTDNKIIKLLINLNNQFENKNSLHKTMFEECTITLSHSQLIQIKS